MDYIREMLKAGDKIMDTVDDAIKSGDYSRLARDITEEMAQFTRNAKSNYRTRNGGYTQTGRSGQTYKTQRTAYNPGGQRTTYRVNYRPKDIDLGTRGQNSQGTSSFWGEQNEARARAAEAQAKARAAQAQAEAQARAQAQARARGQAQQNTWNNRGMALTPFNQYKSKAGSGLLKQTAGVTGLFITVPVAAAAIVTAAAAATPAAIAGAAIWGIGAGVSGYFTAKGSKQRKITRTFDKYSKIIGSKEYTTIEELAESSGETVDMVQENLNDMIDVGLLPQAKFDTGKTTLMLTKNAYDQYLLAENARKDREREEAELDAKTGSSPEARKVISDGEAFVTKIKQANDLIPGEEMTAKLDQMERIVSKIFAQVRKDPSSAGDLRKFMNYYLPTTEKLLNAYIELDKQPEVGSNITNTKREIEQSVDVINDAFENLLDSLFQDVAWDISSDISVMKTMMEQDGLTKKNIAEATAAADAGVDEGIPDIKDAIDLTLEGAKEDAAREDVAKDGEDVSETGSDIGEDVSEE